ncbi:hypothetical protein FACS1894200_08030 [Spirochaetia bacterium]|nr:hypothetical protein FACS1894200_08030 [Spirochaetia bacterium]
MSNENDVVVSQSLTYIGPLPTASEFAGYNDALPGAADRILTIAENESKHRHKLQDESVKLNSKGQWFAFLVTLAALGAIAPAIVALTSLGAVFIKK